MVGIVIVSHSPKVSEGIRELALEMADPGVRIIAAGGMADGALGTDAVRISGAVAEADSGEGVVILVDIGSAVMSSGLALELMEESLRGRVRIADAPILEGALGAAVQASIGAPLEDVAAAAEEARGMKKL